MAAKRNWRTTVFGLLVVGLFLAMRGSIVVEDTRDYLNSSEWATTEGTRIPDNNKTAFINFEYTVNDTRYVGTRTRFYQLVLFSGDSEVTKFAETYPIGSEFTVYYDPGNPERSVINPAFPVGRAVLQVCLLAIVIPIAIVITTITRWIRKPSTG